MIYVGKARSLRKRVAGHFKARGPTTERGLELLTQVHDIDYTETASWLEAAVLETDEIKRLDPPYNVQLRTAERSAWFAARDLTRAAPRPDAEHRVGPLPSERALVGLAALIALADGAEPAPRLLAGALAVPATLLPPPELFAEGLGTFAAEWLPPRPGVSGARRVLDASRVIWLQRGRAEPESADDMAQGDWDLPRVRRRLERSLVQGGLLVRRARALCLLADADVAFREPDAGTARLLVIAHGRIVERTTLNDVAELQNLRVRPAPPLFVRQGAFDAATYDRLRVVLTELRRIHDSRGQVTLRVGAHVLRGAALAHALRAL